MGAPKDVLAKLHEELAEALATRIRSGEASAADLNVARQFLKDNGIESDPDRPSPEMESLLEELADLPEELPH